MQQQCNQNLFLGIDLGSSFIKLSLVTEQQDVVLSHRVPKQQMQIINPHFNFASNKDKGHDNQEIGKSGWAEQDPQKWWEQLVEGLKAVLNERNAKKIKGIGISYQMHGLVLVDEYQRAIRNCIIWCDSRAGHIGEQIHQKIIENGLINTVINHPSNFTISKLIWVRQNQPQNYKKIHKIMLPGDYIAMKLSSITQTTPQGLSQSLFLNPSTPTTPLNIPLLSLLSIPPGFFPALTHNFTPQCYTSSSFNQLFHTDSIPIYYRCGDQPNNAFALDVLRRGEVAVTGGTSGVVFAVDYWRNGSDWDKEAKLYNFFLHLQRPKKDLNEKNQIAFGRLMCISGFGIVYQWLRRNFCQNLTYHQMDKISKQAQSQGIIIIPFGNGSQRILNNKDLNCSILGINFNIHNKQHIIRAAVEGIAFSFVYGTNLMRENKVPIEKMKAGKGNMFECEIFCQIVSTLLQLEIEIYQTNGSQGAAKGALLGYLIDKKSQQAKKFEVKVKMTKVCYPNMQHRQKYQTLYERWKQKLEHLLTTTK